MKKIIGFIMALIMSVSIVSLSAGCGEHKPTDTIRYIIYSSGGTLDDSDRIRAAANKITKERLGFGVNFEYLGYDDYKQKLGMYLNSDERYDMCYTGSIISGLTYSDVVAGGYFKDITNLLPKYAPELYASMSEDIWKAARVNGKIYGVINEQIFARSVGLCIDTEIAEAINLTQEKIDEENLDYRTCINMAMEYIKGQESISPGGKVPSTTLVIGEAWMDIIMQNYALDSLGTDAIVPGIIETKSGENKVINQYESDYFKEFVNFCMEMHEKGYIDENQASAPITPNQRVRIVGTYKPGAEADLYNAVGRRFTQFRFGTPFLTTYNVTTSMTAINVRSGNADKCLKFMNLMYTDKEFYNLVALGEEGTDYDWKQDVDDNGEVYDYVSYVKTGKYKLNTDWSVGTEFNAYRKYLQPATVVEETRELNRNGLRSPAYGFTFIPSGTVSSSMSSCHKSASTVIKQLLNGKYDNTKSAETIINELNAELKSNGLDGILSAKQKQLDEYIAKNK